MTIGSSGFVPPLEIDDQWNPDVAIGDTIYTYTFEGVAMEINAKGRLVPLTVLPYPGDSRRAYYLEESHTLLVGGVVDSGASGSLAVNGSGKVVGVVSGSGTDLVSVAYPPTLLRATILDSCNDYLVKKMVRDSKP